MINKRVEAVRAEMKKQQIDAYYFGRADAHQSEYVSDHWNRLRAMTGFTGSAGSAIITMDVALLWVDGRYYLQGDNETAGTVWKVMRLGLEGVLEPIEWLGAHMKNNTVLGVDGRTISIVEEKNLIEMLEHKDIIINGAQDVIDAAWDNRPPMPTDEIFEHTMDFAGNSRVEKISNVRKEMKNKGVAAYYIASLDDIAWLLNARAWDTGHDPTFYAHVYLDATDIILFVADNRLSPQLEASLINDEITIKPYDEIFNFLDTLASYPIYISPSKVSMYTNQFLQKGKQVHGLDLTTVMKSVKSPEELKHVRHSQATDALAMFRFMKWLKEGVIKPDWDIDEVDIADKLLELRSQGANFLSPSFSTIAAYQENAALMHYRAEKETAKAILPTDMLLVDSGGQYLNGTTDITRTYILGEVSDEMKIDYTLTLRSHIQVAMGKFLYGTPGIEVDMLARKPMWDRGKDYKCGTGHGIGYFLCVHEGPQRIGAEKTPYPLEVGMLITNEPGVYRAGQHGVRIENIIEVVELEKTDDGTFLGFNTLTFVPIDLDGIIVDMLLPAERAWLNDYHDKTNHLLSPHLNEDEKVFLNQYTKAI